MDKEESTSMAVFSNPEELLSAVRVMASRGVKNIEVLSPFDLPELHELLPQPPSKVRWYTMVGAVSGGAAAMAFMIMTVLLWPLVTGGKRVVTVSAFIPITFEVFILLGGISTLLGLVLLARLTAITSKAFHAGASQNDFVLFISHKLPEYADVEAQLREAGARDVRLYNPGPFAAGVLE